MVFCASVGAAQASSPAPLKDVPLQSVRIQDEFWSPKMDVWRTVTINDVLDKFGGDYSKAGERKAADTGKLDPNMVTSDPRWFGDAYANWDRVAAGEYGKGGHVGKCFFDGLIYGSIRAAADFLAANRDPALEARVDGLIDRFVAAQSEDGYINTKVDLDAPQDRFEALGNGGYPYPAWHERYNMGGLFEAAVHYYKATGKTKFLSAAVKLANLCCDTMGPPPKKNVVPAHALPEMALVELYELFKAEPNLKDKLGVPVREDDYLALAKFWIENRGNHNGIRNARMKNDPRFSPSSRMSLGSYAQDAYNPLELDTIDGHAVRATLLGTGMAAVTLNDDDPRFHKASSAWWDNMVGKRMFLTGGVGSNTRSEAFGADYFLPAANSYLETCANVGAGFFSQKMGLREKDSKYFDELERVLYNGALGSVSKKGDTYAYKNELTHKTNRGRWAWNGTPCCPPMFLKMMAAIPSYVYSVGDNELYVQLFVQSDADLKVGGKDVKLSQKTKYPHDGKVGITLDSDVKDLALKIRIPSWARGIENPYGLYEPTTAATPVTASLNGRALDMELQDGYLVIKRDWRKGDKIELNLPMQPRWVRAHPRAEELVGQRAVMRGPVVYSLEQVDNPLFLALWFDTREPLSARLDKDVLGGTWVVEGTALDKEMKPIKFKAIPFYLLGNRGDKNGYRTWSWAYPPRNQ